MKKNNWILGLSAGAVAAAACAVVKGIMDNKFGNDDLNDQEVPKVNDSEDEDRGVAPITAEHAEDTEDEVHDLKADAINHGYVPIKY